MTFNSSFETEQLAIPTGDGATQTRAPCLWRPNVPTTCRGVVQPAIPILTDVHAANLASPAEYTGMVTRVTTPEKLERLDAWLASLST